MKTLLWILGILVVCNKMTDPSLVAVDGSFATARQKAFGVSWGQEMADELEAKRAAINSKKARIAPVYQVPNFPAKYKGIPPLIVMTAASRKSMASGGGGGGRAQSQTEFQHWIKMINSYKMARKQPLGFDHQLRADDVKQLVKLIAESLVGQTRTLGDQGRWNKTGDTKAFFRAAEFGEIKWSDEAEEQHLNTAETVAALLDIHKLSKKRKKWGVNWSGDLVEEDLNLELISIYTGSAKTDEGKGIFRKLNQVAAKQGNPKFVPTAYDLSLFPFATQLELAIFSSSFLRFNCSSSVKLPNCTLFRGVHGIDKMTIESAYQQKREVILTSFTSSSKTQTRAKEVLCTESLSAKNIDVLFQYHLNPSTWSRFWPIDIEKVSQHKEEKEALLPMGATFLVKEAAKEIPCENDKSRKFFLFTLELQK